MTGTLPRSLEVGGERRRIRADFRIALNIFEKINDESLQPFDKAYITFKALYEDDIPAEHFKEAVEKAFWFLDGGDMPKSKPSPVRMIDWKHDEQMIFPAVNKAAGCEIRELPFMHWWSFLGYMGEVGDGLYSTVMNIRHKTAYGKKLEKHEREFLRRHRELVVLRTKEEQAEIAETEEFLKTLLG